MVYTIGMGLLFTLFAKAGADFRSRASENKAEERSRCGQGLCCVEIERFHGSVGGDLIHRSARYASAASILGCHYPTAVVLSNIFSAEFQSSSLQDQDLSISTSAIYAI